MNTLAEDYSTTLLAARKGPCLSLYQPTHRHRPENQQDPIRFGNLVKAIERSLRQKYPRCEVEPLLRPFRDLAGDSGFWNHSLAGLAVLAAPGLSRVYRLQRPVPELAVVADSFHLKPLRRILQSADRYQVLGLNRKQVQLFEGNRDALDEIELAENVPRTITEALGDQLTEPHQTVVSYRAGANGSALVHGHGSGKDEIDIDMERFFRAVDRAVLERHSRPSGLPLILAALPEHHEPFRRLSHNPFLAAEALNAHPDTLSADALRDRIWSIVEPRYLARLARLTDEFEAARSRGFGAEDVQEAAAAAAAGRVSILLVDADRRIPGRLDPGTGGIELAGPDRPETDDLLDDLGELVMAKGGEIVVVPGERMPTQTGLAATYRY